ncbi:hypothetical protein B9Z55_007495 [Caenorhabditis nigoni]|uniref:Secreted protein n=1 Tax=Caenorhabditis nigoni TaxID=1611254 RepID=A0A2G5VA32_9PELO|nr:hypothetical protein B9Z55_007495 [Caenorhabditis nigoni]
MCAPNNFYFSGFLFLFLYSWDLESSNLDFSQFFFWNLKETDRNCNENMCRLLGLFPKKKTISSCPQTAIQRETDHGTAFL